MRVVPLLALSGLVFAQDAPPDPEALVERLREVAEPRDGLRDDAGGGPYLTLTEDPFGGLVRMGPAAIPALLRHLDDARGTGLSFRGHEGFGGMFRSRELLVPPGRAAERKRIRDAFGEGVETEAPGDGVDLESGGLPGHDVTVGDCCFAILGQIVNRPYEAVRYQPSAITAVCSPTLDPRIAKAVRALWGRGDPRELLAGSLVEDFRTRGPGSSWLQAGAAARLCLWFPQSAPLVAQRVAGLTFDGEKDGIDAGDLLGQVLEIDHPAVREAWLGFVDPERPDAVLRVALRAIRRKPDPAAELRIRAVFDRTEDVEVLLACLEWLPLEGEALFPRLERNLREAEAAGARGYAHCQGLIDVMIRADRTRAAEACRRHMAGGMPRKLTVLGSLWAAKDRGLALALAPPLLDDATRAEWAGIPTSIAFRTSDRRVCDYAAAVLARCIDGLSFTNDEHVGVRDREIDEIRKALASR